MIDRLRKKLALLLSLALCLSFSPAATYAADGDMITILMRAPVDIAFVIDSTGSMKDEIKAVSNNIMSFLDKLYDYNRRIKATSDIGVGIDPRIAIIDFKDVYSAYEVSTFHTKADGSYWFVKNEFTDDGEELKNIVAGIKAIGGIQPDAEAPTEALERLYNTDNFEWRSDAQKFVFLITDADFMEGDIGNNIRLPLMSDVIQELSGRDIHTSVATASGNLQNKYSDLYTETGGKFYDIGELSFMEQIIKQMKDELDDLIDSLNVNVSIKASGAPSGNGSVKLLRYTDRNQRELEGPIVFSGDKPATVSAPWGSPVDLEISAEDIKEDAAAPDGDTYVIDKIIINDEVQDFSVSDISDYQISDLKLGTDTTIWVLFSKKHECPEISEEPAPEGLPSDWTKLRHVTHENAISTNYCVIARKQKFDVKPYINKAEVYRSSNKKIASVGKKSGIVKGKKSGDAEITGYVRSGGQLIPTGSYTIHVVTPELNRKQYLSFNTEGYVDGNEHVVNEILSPSVWKSSNPSVASVSENSGMISVNSAKGKAKITAFYGLGKNAAKYKFTLRIRPSAVSANLY